MGSPLFPGYPIPGPADPDQRTFTESLKRAPGAFRNWWDTDRVNPRVQAQQAFAAGDQIPAPPINTRDWELDQREASVNALSPEDQFGRIQRLKAAQGAELDPMQAPMEPEPMVPPMPESRPSLGFAWGGGTPQEYRPGMDIDSGQFGQRETPDIPPMSQGEEMFPRANQTLAGNSARFGNEGGGSFSQIEQKDVPIGQRANISSMIEDAGLEAQLAGLGREKATAEAFARDPMAKERFKAGADIFGKQAQERAKFGAQFEDLDIFVEQDLMQQLQEIEAAPATPQQKQAAKQNAIREAVQQKRKYRESVINRGNDQLDLSSILTPQG